MSVPDFIQNISSEWGIAIFSAILTSVVSILGIYLTIRHNNKMIKIQLRQQEEAFKEDKRLQLLPYIKYDLVNTVEKSHLGHDNGGVSFFPYGFINGGDGQPEKFFSKVKISNKLLIIKNIGKNPCMYFRAIKLRADNHAETKSIEFPFEINSLEINESSDMFIQSGIPIELPIDSKFMKYEEIPQNYELYLDVCYGDMLGNYYEQTVALNIFPIPIFYQDHSPTSFELDMRIVNTSIPIYVKEKNIFNEQPTGLKVKFSGK